VGSVLFWSHDDFKFVLQGDLEDIAMLFLDAKASARLLQEQPDKYVSQ
jgi:RuvB-like protein 1 (pontin 52)